MYDDLYSQPIVEDNPTQNGKWPHQKMEKPQTVPIVTWSDNIFQTILLFTLFYKKLSLGNWKILRKS